MIFIRFLYDFYLILYDFIYTGENKDVLDVDLNYQFAYFQPGRYYDAFQNKLKNDDDSLAEEGTGGQSPRGGLKDGRRSSKVARPPIAPQSADTVNPDAPAPNREMADVFRKILDLRVFSFTLHNKMRF